MGIGRFRPNSLVAYDAATCPDDGIEVSSCPVAVHPAESATEPPAAAPPRTDPGTTCHASDEGPALASRPLSQTVESASSPNSRPLQRVQAAAGHHQRQQRQSALLTSITGRGLSLRPIRPTMSTTATITTRPAPPDHVVATFVARTDQQRSIKQHDSTAPRYTAKNDRPISASFWPALLARLRLPPADAKPSQCFASLAPMIQCVIVMGIAVAKSVMMPSASSPLSPRHQRAHRQKRQKARRNRQHPAQVNPAASGEPGHFAQKRQQRRNQQGHFQPFPAVIVSDARNAATCPPAPFPLRPASPALP